MTQEMRATALAEAVKNAHGNYDADNLVKMAEAFYAFLAKGAPEQDGGIFASREGIAKAIGCTVDGQTMTEFMDMLSECCFHLGWKITVVP